MITLIITIAVFLVLIVGSLLLAMMVFNHAKISMKNMVDNPAPPIKFSIKYVALSLAVLALTILMVAIISPKLPVSIGYNFNADGDPTSVMRRASLIIWTLLPQLMLTVMALIVGWGVTKLSNVFRTPQEGGLPVNGLLLVMGNIIGLPQLIITYAMANIFTYNAYQVTLPPIWIVTVIVMGIAGVILGVFFINMIRKMGGFTLRDK